MRRNDTSVLFLPQTSEIFRLFNLDSCVFINDRKGGVSLCSDVKNFGTLKIPHILQPHIC